MSSFDPSPTLTSSRGIEKMQDEEKMVTAEEPVSHNERPECFKSTFQEILFVFTATMSVATPSFLQGATIVISSFIGKDLNMSTSQITWITASSALTSGSFLLFFGKVADMFGRRAILLGSLLLFTIFSLATGFSRDAITLNVLNGVIGLVSAAAIPTAQGTLGSIYIKPCKRKNYAFACFSAGNPLGFVFSSVFSGIATQLFGWRASFYLLAIIYLFVTVIAYFSVPIDDDDKLPFTVESFKQFDVIGAALTIGGIGLFTTGLSIGTDAPQGWKTPYVLVCIILGVLMMVTFVWWENRFQYPLMPVKIWRDKDFSLLIAILTLGYLSFPPMLFFVALYLQELFKLSALMTAVHMLPMAISGVAVNIVAGLILHKISNKLLMGIAASAYTLAFLLIAVQRSGASYWAFTFPALILSIVGTDLEFNVGNMYVLSALPKSQQSVAGSIFQTITKLSVTTGLSVCTAIFTSVANNPAQSGYYANDPFEPYAASMWFAMATTFLSILLVPFLSIKTQGGNPA